MFKKIALKNYNFFKTTGTIRANTLPCCSLTEFRMYQKVRDLDFHLLRIKNFTTHSNFKM